MLPDRVSNPGPLTYKSCALPIALRGPATAFGHELVHMLLTVVEALFCMKQLNISGQYWKTKLGFHQYIRRVVSALIHVLWSHRQF